MGGEVQHTKDLLRRRLLAARRAVPRDVLARLSMAVCARAVGLSAFRTAEHVVGYDPIGGEVDPRDALTVAVSSGKAVYIAPRDGGEVGFRAKGDGSRASRAGILPPDGRAVVFLVPGVAFDPAGRRLGRGGGWYDRVLPRYPEAFRAGLALEMQLVPTVPAENHDVALDAVVTETRTLGPLNREKKEMSS